VKTVCIVGMGPSYNAFIQELMTQDRKEPIADEIWAINCAVFPVRCNRVFWMDDLQREAERNDYCVKDLARLGVPVITSKAYPDLVPNSMAYPINEAVELSLQLFNDVYLPNTICYAIALAMLEGFERIKIYGADFTYPNRNFAESGRASVEAWLMAYKAGDGEVSLPESTSLFNRAGQVDNDGNLIPRSLYGYDDQPVITLTDGRTLRVVTPNQESDILGRRLIALIKEGAAENAEEIDEVLRKQKVLSAQQDAAHHQSALEQANARILEVKTNG